MLHAVWSTHSAAGRGGFFLGAWLSTLALALRLALDELPPPGSNDEPIDELFETLKNGFHTLEQRLRQTGNLKPTHRTHRGPLVYADRDGLVHDLHVALERLVREYDKISPRRVADALPIPISVVTLRSRMVGHGLMSKGASLTATLRQLADEYRHRLGLL